MDAKTETINREIDKCITKPSLKNVYISDNKNIVNLKVEEHTKRKDTYEKQKTIRKYTVELTET